MSVLLLSVLLYLPSWGVMVPSLSSDWRGGPAFLCSLVLLVSCLLVCFLLLLCLALPSNLLTYLTYLPTPYLLTAYLLTYSLTYPAYWRTELISNRFVSFQRGAFVCSQIDFSTWYSFCLAVIGFQHFVAVMMFFPHLCCNGVLFMFVILVFSLLKPLWRDLPLDGVGWERDSEMRDNGVGRKL